MYGADSQVGEANFTGFPSLLYPYIIKSGSANVKMGCGSGTSIINGKQANKGLSLYMQAATNSTTTVKYSNT